MPGDSLSGQPRTVQWLRSAIAAATVVGAGTYVMGDGVAGGVATTSSGNNPFRVFSLDPNEWVVYDQTTDFEIDVQLASGGVNPAVDVYVSLFEVTGFAGSGTGVTIVLGSEVVGSRTPTRTVGALSTVYPVDKSGPFQLSTAGLYALCIHSSGALAANSTVTVSGRLQVSGR